MRGEGHNATSMRTKAAAVEGMRPVATPKIMRIEPATMDSWWTLGSYMISRGGVGLWNVASNDKVKV